MDEYLAKTPDLGDLAQVEVEGAEGEAWALGRGLQEPTWKTRHGEWVFFYSSGEKHSSVEYAAGRMQGIRRVWHANGELAAEEHYVEGRKEGPYRDWWDDGTPRRRGTLLNDAYSGTWWFRNRDGSWYEAETVGGEIHGIVKYFGPNDVHFATAEWDRGHRLWQETREPDGKNWNRVEFDRDGNPK